MVSDRVYAKLQVDLRDTGRAVARRGWFGWRRVKPSQSIVLQVVYTPEAVLGAKQDGSLVEEFTHEVPT